MSDYPECDRMAEASELTPPIGEFLDWLTSQGVQLMVWREDLTDVRPTDPVCPVRRRPALEERRIGEPGKLPCDPARDDGPAGNLPYYMGHCKHWQHPDQAIGGGGAPGTCCHCGQGAEHEVAGLKAWVHDPRSTGQLLADWAGIDLKKVEAERQQILAGLQAANQA